MQSQSLSLTQKAAFRLYNLCWSLAIPLLRFNRRVAVGFEQRRMHKKLSAAQIWIQSASVGESLLAAELLKKLNPHRRLNMLFTTNTRQGLEILNRSVGDTGLYSNKISARTAYFPFDKPAIMQAAVRAVQPKVMVLLETEIWPGLLQSLKTSGCKILILNGRLTEKSLNRYSIWSGFWPALQPDHILAVSDEDAKRFKTLFPDSCIEVMPNIKFDRISFADAAEEVKPVFNFLAEADGFVVLGSVRQEEESQVEKIIGAIRDRRPQATIGLFPRHMHRVAAWQDRLKRLAVPWVLRSEITETILPGQVIVWDTIGELMSAYRAAKAVFVGGTLTPPLGGQNFLEPLVGGSIPIIGPNWKNFAWVGSEILAEGLVRVAADWESAANLLINDLAGPENQEAVQQRARRYVAGRQGGTELACRIIIEQLQEALP
jgi:3-deoxy-D-manno-octulosonic-acid transferase